MHRKLRVLFILLVLFAASYSHAAVNFDQKITVYDAAKSRILQNLAGNSSYPILENRLYQTISRLSNDINRNRYYSPALGRFTSKDPIGFNGGNNLYRYADNNPVLFVDPLGLLTSGQGFYHYLGHPQIDDFGNVAFPGENLKMNFNDVDTSSITPTYFPKVVSALAAECCLNKTIQIIDKNSYLTKGDHFFLLGNITLKLEGTLTLRSDCTWLFSGLLKSYNDTYDFNRAKRGLFGETLTAIGGSLHGQTFDIEFVGSKSISQSRSYGN